MLSSLLQMQNFFFFQHTFCWAEAMPLFYQWAENMFYHWCTVTAGDWNLLLTASAFQDFEQSYFSGPLTDFEQTYFSGLLADWTNIFQWALGKFWTRRRLPLYKSSNAGCSETFCDLSEYWVVLVYVTYVFCNSFSQIMNCTVLAQFKTGIFISMNCSVWS